MPPCRNDRLPTHSDLWSFRMDYTNKKMDPWERIVPPFHFDPEMSFVNIVVPTVDTIRYSYLLDKLLAVNTSVMFTGGTGQWLPQRGGGRSYCTSVCAILHYQQVLHSA